MNNSKGFTLVELAIVLVIIGVILGGVMKGQQLVISAKNKRLVRDFQTLQTAVYTYQDLMGNLPGDNEAAPTGRIDGNTTAGQFWADIRTRNLFNGTGTDAPSNIFGGTMTVGSTAETTAGIGRNSVCMTNIPADSGGTIDSKYDDNNPTTGDIHGGTDITASVATAYTGTGTITLCFRFD